MDSNAVAEALKDAVPEGAVEPVTSGDGMATLYVAREHLVDVCRELRERPELAFTLAADMTAVDFMPREPRFEVVVHLAALGSGGSPKRLRIKVRVPGEDARLPTVSGIWPAMNWAEREVWDLFGIHFENHPDMRRILMPDDWEGHPARKDYPVQIKMTPKVYEPLQLSPDQFAANIRADRDRARQE